MAVNAASGVSALYGKTVLAIAAGDYHSLAFCSDGTVAAWGANGAGQLGDNTTTPRLVPVAVNTTPLASGERFTRVASANEAWHTLALVASPPPPASVMTVTCNGVTIINGGGEEGGIISFGTATVGTTVARTFAVENLGAAPLNLTGTPKVTVSGPQPADFAVTLQPSSPVASGGGTTTFQITFSPLATGERWATVSIASDDTANNPYTFYICGTGSSPPIILTNPHKLADGSFFFSFIYTPAVPFTVLFTTDLSQPLNDWTPVPGLFEPAAGVYQFYDPEAANHPRRFYRVRSP